MTRRLNYVEDLGQARCAQLIRVKHNDRSTCEIHLQTGCWLFRGSLNTDGYGQVSFQPYQSRSV